MLALIAATPAVLLASYGPSRAEIVNLKADLTGSEETPPSTGAGTGIFDLRTKTKKLTWAIAYSGLTGPATRRTSTDRGVGSMVHQGPRHCEPQSDRGLRDFDQAYGQGPG